MEMEENDSTSSYIFNSIFLHSLPEISLLNISKFTFEIRYLFPILPVVIHSQFRLICILMIMEYENETLNVKSM